MDLEAVLGGMGLIELADLRQTLEFVDQGAVERDRAERGLERGVRGDGEPAHRDPMGRPEQDDALDAVARRPEAGIDRSRDRPRVDIAGVRRDDDLGDVLLGTVALVQGVADERTHHGAELGAIDRIEGPRYRGRADFGIAAQAHREISGPGAMRGHAPGRWSVWTIF